MKRHRRRQHLIHFALILHIVRTGIQHHFHQTVFSDCIDFDRDHTQLGELKRDRPAGREITAVELKNLTEFRGRSRTIVG